MVSLAWYAVLAWLGHLLALYAVWVHGWDGFKLAAVLNLIWQAGLVKWFLREDALPRYQKWRAGRRRPAAGWQGRSQVWRRY